MAHTHAHTKDRRRAVQALYSAAIRDTRADTLLREGCMDCIEGPMTDYSLGLINGVEAHRCELDAMIDAASTNWAISRMPTLDLAILRTALFEMLYIDTVPVAVSIDEAVELAKYFSADEDSHKFINGLLGQIARTNLNLNDGDSEGEGRGEGGACRTDVAAADAFDKATVSFAPAAEKTQTPCAIADEISEASK